jgi:hypothetical protein
MRAFRRTLETEGYVPESSRSSDVSSKRLAHRSLDQHVGSHTRAARFVASGLGSLTTLSARSRPLSADYELFA